MDREEVERLIYRILATEDEEIDCQQLSELIARYVDLEVAGADALRLLPLVYQHLEQCDACAELHDVLYELAALEARGELPDAGRLLDEIVAESPPRAASSRPPGGADGRRRPLEDVDFGFRDAEYGPEDELAIAGWFRWGWVAAGAALVMLVIFGVWGWRQASVIAEMERKTSFIARADRTIWMQGTDDDPDARGFLFINDAEERGLLVIDGLNEPATDRVYQMWLMFDDRDAVSAGTFVVGGGEQGRVWVDLEEAPASFASLEITLEPEGGSPHPTSKPVCIWGKRQS